MGENHFHIIMQVVAYKDRYYVPAPIYVPKLFEDVRGQLARAFQDVALFGGCLRESYIGQIPFHDIDVNATLASSDKMPHAFHTAFQHAKDEWVTPDAQLRAIFRSWTGFLLTAYKTQNDQYRFLCTTDDDRHHEIDLSVNMDTPPPKRDVPFALTRLAGTTSPFSSVAYDNTGVWAHCDFMHDTDAMHFQIFRDRGLRATIWTIPYFEHMKGKYPDLQLANAEARLYLLWQKIRAIGQKTPQETSAQSAESLLHAQP